MTYNEGMEDNLLRTKLHPPRPRPSLVPRPRLLDRLQAGSAGKLTLVSAPAGFGKTTLVSDWLMAAERPYTWLSLDAGDGDPTRFFTYFIAALQAMVPGLGTKIVAQLTSPQPPPVQSLLPSLVNEIAIAPRPFTLVLDDYHAVDSGAVDEALTFIIDQLPPQMHLVITTREDPDLPLSRLRVRGQLTELRVADLRFTLTEAAAFLNETMGLALTEANIAALEQRTEGWIAGLQLAALALQGGGDDAAEFIDEFTGSHRFVLDYLVEEVLHQQPPAVQTFLFKTALLDQLCGPLCEAMLDDPAINGQRMLEYLDQANLFLIPLDSRRRWYRYHHLFGDLLRQRLQKEATDEIPTLHRRAGDWFSEQGMDLAAFQHAAAAGDIARAEELISGDGTPLYLRGGALPVRRWLESLPKTVLDARPSLWVMFGWVLWIDYRSPEVEPKLAAAEAALSNAPAAHRDDLHGNIAAMRANLLANDYQTAAMLHHAQQALTLLDADNLYARAAATRILGLAHQFQGNRDAAIQDYAATIALCKAADNSFMEMLTATSLGVMQEQQNQLPQAAQTYRHVLQLAGEPAPPLTCEAHLGLGRIHYQWNDLAVAEQFAQVGVRLAKEIAGIDTAVAGQLFRARIQLAQGDLAGAETAAAELAQIAQQEGHAQQIPRIAAFQAQVWLRQGRETTVAQLLERHELPLIRARLLLVQGDGGAAAAILDQLLAQAVARQWRDEELQSRLLQARVNQLLGNGETAVQHITAALQLAAPGGMRRIFLDEGATIAPLLAAAQGAAPAFTSELLEQLAAENQSMGGQTAVSQPLLDPLSERELEILQLVAQGLSNRQISERLYLALSTVKGHNRNIYSKLGVSRRTEAVARGRELGLL